MANNIINEGYSFNWSVVCSNPAEPDTGDPVRWGAVTGIALTDEGDGGNAATETTVKFGVFVVENILVDDNESTGIAVGDKLYYQDTATGTPTTHINNSSSTGVLFGMALGVVASDATTAINVLHLM